MVSPRDFILDSRFHHNGSFPAKIQLAGLIRCRKAADGGSILKNFEIFETSSLKYFLVNMSSLVKIVVGIFCNKTSVDSLL